MYSHRKCCAINIVVIVSDDQGYADISLNPLHPQELSTPKWRCPAWVETKCITRRGNPATSTPACQRAYAERLACRSVWLHD